ncbi:MAG: oligosaccharide flippase family protein [Myxococcales bacterium]|nr:oligosaccharide flippase family protein [Myxococcales bacterium]
MLARLRALSAGSTLRSVAVLMTGTLLAQVITISITPILSRLYAPADFGALGLLNAVVMPLIGVAALRYDMAIVIPREERDAAGLLRLSMLCVLGLSGLLLVVIALGRAPIAEALGEPLLAEWLWVAPMILLASGSYGVLNYWNTRQKTFRRLSNAAVLAAGGSGGMKVGLGLLSFGAAGLVFGQLLGQIVASVALAWQTLRVEHRALGGAQGSASLRTLARRHSDFPIYQVPITLLNGLSQSIPVYLLGGLFGSASVGHWALALMVLTMPVFLVSGALRQVMLQRGSELQHQGQSLLPLLGRSTALLALASLPVLAIGLWIAPALFALVFGAEWQAAGELARAMGVWQWSALISTPAAALFPVLRIQGRTLVWQLFAILLGAGAFMFGAEGGASLDAITAYSAAMVLSNLALILMVLLSARGRRGGDASS